MDANYSQIRTIRVEFDPFENNSIQGIVGITDDAINL